MSTKQTDRKMATIQSNPAHIIMPTKAAKASTKTRQDHTARRSSDDPELRRAVWSCRVFVLAFAALVGMMMCAGFDWMVAIFLSVCFVLMLLMIARVTAELGLPYLWSFLNTAQFI